MEYKQDQRQDQVYRRIHKLVEFLPHSDTFAARLAEPLRANPGENGFIRSFVISNWFPIIAASLGPVASMNSVVALADKWRQPVDGSAPPGDKTWVLALNSLSLFFGCVANISLFLNYAKRISYSISQPVSIGGWYLACALLVGLQISTEYIYFDNDLYVRSQGFWHGVITTILYFISATLLLVNELGHLCGLYQASFNLTTRQRSIMVQNVALITWLAAGAAVFAHLMEINYATGVYYCTVSVLTVGLGDYTPETVLGRALCLPYAFVGVILLGLIIATIRQIVLEAGGQTVRFHISEKNRVKKLNKIEQLDQTQQPDERSMFETMRDVHTKTMRRSSIRSVVISSIVFVSFVLLGAMVFYFTEPSWTYFEAVYFCCLCVLTIGYGDFSPTSAAGQSFWVVWSLAAVPLMTILISNLGETLFKVLLEGGNKLGNVFLRGNNTPKSANEVMIPRLRSMELEWDSEEAAALPDPQPPEPHHHDPKISHLADLFRELRTVVGHVISDSKKVYTFEEWYRMLQLTKKDRASKGASKWLSQESPLRFQIVESHYFLEQYLNVIEDELRALVRENTNK